MKENDENKARGVTVHYNEHLVSLDESVGGQQMTNEC